LFENQRFSPIKGGQSGSFRRLAPGIARQAPQQERQHLADGPAGGKNGDLCGGEWCGMETEDGNQGKWQIGLLSP
jgi:hypothetical protein